MSWLYLPAPAVAYLRRAGCWGGKRFVMWSAPVTRSKLSGLVFGTACSMTRRSGTTPIPSTGNRGLDWWMLLQRASHASRSAWQESEPGKTTSATGGRRPFESFARYDPDTSCWRTSQGSLLTLILEPYSGTWPRQGILDSGACYRRPALEPPISAKGFGLLPTPKASDAIRGSPNQKDGKGRPYLTGAALLWPTPTVGDAMGGRTTSKGKDHPTSLNMAVRLWPTPTVSDATGGAAYSQPPSREGGPGLKEITHGGALNPEWVAWLMGWPIGWTGLQPLEMDRFREWLQKHGISWEGTR